jgi:hypothetical protein
MSCSANAALRRLGLAQARINLHTFDVVYQVIILLRTCQPSAPTHRHTTRNSSLRSSIFSRLFGSSGSAS